MIPMRVLDSSKPENFTPASISALRAESVM
jgi:hypothetical protein